MNRPTTVLRGALAALAIVAAGCGGGGGTQEKVVARAGDLEITLAEFHDSYMKISPNYRPDISTLEGKRSFANDLVNGRIMVLEGEAMGGITDPEIIAALDSNRRSAMLGILYRAEIVSKVDVLGSDVKELYDHRQVHVVASHILLDDEASAQRIRAQIEAGEVTFAEAAQEHSMDQGTRRQGGSLGELRWGRTVPAFQQLAFDLEPGELSQPVETNFGWHLVLVQERIEQELPSLEEMRPALRKEVRNQMEGERMREYLAGLEAKRNLTWNEDALEELRDAIREMATVDIDTVPPVDQNVPIIAEEDRGDALAVWTGGEWTKGDYVDAIRAQPARARPPSVIPANGMKELIRTAQVDEKLLAIEAEELGFGDDPEVTSGAERLREQVLVETVHGRFIQAADVTPEDAKALYDSTLAEDPDAMMYPERVDMLIITHQDDAKVREALRRIAAGQDVATVIAEISMDGRTNKKGGRTGLIPRGSYAPQLEEVAFEGRVGKGWSEPVFTETGIGTVKVLVQEDARTARFEEVKDTLIRNLVQARGEEAFEAWLDEQRLSRGVEIYDEILELYGQPISS